MAFNVEHGGGAALLRGSNVAGLGVLQNEADRLKLDQLRVEQAMGQRDREFLINAELRARDQWLDQQRYNTDVALRSQAQAAAGAAQNASLQAGIFRAAMQDQNVLDQLAMKQQFEAEQQGAADFETSVNDELAALRKMKLDPEGKRILGDLSSRLLEIRSQRHALPDAVYDDFLGQWSEDLAMADLRNHEVKEPTIDEIMASKSKELPDGTIVGVDRDGMPRVLREGMHAAPNGVEEFETRDGGFAKWNPVQGKYESFAGPPKETKTADPNAPKPFAFADLSKEIGLAIQMARANAVNADGTGRAFTADEFKAALKEIQEARKAEFGEDSGVMDTIMGALGGMFGGGGGQGGQKPAAPQMQGSGTQQDPIKFSNPPTEQDVLGLDPGTWFVAPDGSVRQR